jgi:hypothetical protein
MLVFRFKVESRTLCHPIVTVRGNRPAPSACARLWRLRLKAFLQAKSKSYFFEWIFNRQAGACLIAPGRLAA